jgi:ATP-binding cassette subfamily F protein 3
VDQFFLVAEGRVEEFKGDLNDYQDWLKQFSREVDLSEQPTEVPAVDKKLARQQSAESRKKVAPLKKEIKAIETQMDKQQTLLNGIEQQLADATIYEEQNKQQLKAVIAEQAELKKVLSALEENWLERQALLEGYAE